MGEVSRVLVGGEVGKWVISLHHVRSRVCVSDWFNVTQYLVESSNDTGEESLQRDDNLVRRDLSTSFIMQQCLSAYCNPRNPPDRLPPPNGPRWF